MESGRQRYEQALRSIIEQHWDETALLAETERIEALVKPYLASQTAAEFAQEEVRGWISQLKNASAEERQEILNSEDFEHLPAKSQQTITQVMEQIEAEEEREGDEGQERGRFITDWSLSGPFILRKDMI